jgi:hypothetical protein
MNVDAVSKDKKTLRKFCIIVIASCTLIFEKLVKLTISTVFCLRSGKRFENY